MTHPPSAIVVGGGPAGLFAAERFAEAGVAVTIYEHRASVGRKFLLAGRGGLNITHSEPLDDLLVRYGPRRPNLEAAVRQFTPDSLREWCDGLQESCFVGTSGRVFPKSLKATPLLRAWLRRLDDRGVEIRTRHTWTGWAHAAATGGESANTGGTSVAMSFLSGDEPIGATADVVVLALGGASWPRVSTDGFWVDSLKAAGVDVAPLEAANCGIRTAWTRTLSDRFAGEPLKNVAVSVSVDGEKVGGRVGGREVRHREVVVRGDVMITESGLEGGPIYAHSAALRNMVGATGEWILHLDLHPDVEESALVARLAKVGRPKDSTSTLLRKAKVSPAAIAVLRDVTGNAIPTEPHELAGLLKAVPICGSAMMPIDRAISSAGGITFDQLTDDFMLADHPGVFVAGEMLDWEAPTGGYLLQACFSTAAVAADGALAYLDAQATPAEPNPH